MSPLVKVTRSGEVYRELSGLAQTMAPGERLPSYKALMDELGASQGAIDAAYARLREQGVVEARPKSGMYVARPYADALVVLICSTMHFRPYQGVGMRQHYIALREAVPAFFPGASVELLVIDYDPRAAVREERVRQRLGDLLARYRVLGAISSFRLDCEETFAFCADRNVPLIDSGTVERPDCYRVPTTSLAYRAGLGLRHLREQGWRDRLLVVTRLETPGSDPKPPPEEMLGQVDSEATIECLHLPVDTDLEAVGARFVKGLLQRPELPAMMITDDYMVRGMIVGALEEGVKLAEACPLVAATNEGVPIRASRELTRVEYPHLAMAQEQLHTLGEILRGNGGYRPQPVPPVLIVGRSSRREDYPSIGTVKDSETP